MVLPQLSTKERSADRHSMLEHKQTNKLVPEVSRSPHRRQAKKHHKPVQRSHCCQQCVYDLRPEEDISLPSIAAGPITLTSQIVKEDTFTNVIDSLNEANKVPEQEPISLTSSSSQSTVSTPRFASNQTSYSTSFDVDSSDSPAEPTNTVTIVSEVPPAPRVMHMPLERLLDFGETSRKVTITCSKYDEIGNPQARKKKHRRALSGKKWNRTTSYANASVVQGQGKKEKLNFMDTQINNIYNSWEKAKIDEKLSPRENRKELPTKAVLAPIPESDNKENSADSFRNISNKSVERYVLNAMMRAKKASKFECKIPTIPLLLKTKPRKLRTHNTIVR